MLKPPVYKLNICSPFMCLKICIELYLICLTLEYGSHMKESVKLDIYIKSKSLLFNNLLSSLSRIQFIYISYKP